MRVRNICSQLCYRFVTLMTLLSLSGAVNYTWLEANDVFDGVVIITLAGEPLVTGVFVGYDAILTSANAVERITDVSSMAVHSIDGYYLKNTRTSVYAITRDYFKRNSKYWMTMGVDNRHCPVFDIAIVSLNRRFNEVVYPQYRSPRLMKALKRYLYQSVAPLNKTATISFASFGFIDEAHLNDSRDLEMAEYTVGDVVVDCDEWIPRAWGHFVCLLNVENFLCNGAGAPLMLDELMIGLGAFSVTKGNESILVFTDTRKYMEMFYTSGFFRPGNAKIY